MTPEQAVAEDAVHRVREKIEELTGKSLPIPSQMVSALASVFLGAVAFAAGVAVKNAEIAGLERAGKVIDADSAEAAAIERNK